MDYCVCCGAIIPEGRMICPRCEQEEIKTGMILQSNGATKEEAQEAYEWLCQYVLKGGDIDDIRISCKTKRKIPR